MSFGCVGRGKGKDMRVAREGRWEMLGGVGEGMGEGGIIPVSFRERVFR